MGSQEGITLIMILTKKEKSSLVGMILGDAYLQATGKRNARLRLEHSLKQKKYLEWKISLLPLQFQGVKHIDRIHPKTRKKYSYVRAQSDASPILGKMRSLFYPYGKKQIPENLSRYLRHPLGLAVWYMDDGYYSNRSHDRSVHIYLGKVTEKEAHSAREAIEKRFLLKSTVVNKKEKGFLLYFSPKETKKFFSVIQRYVIEEMRYKLPS